MNMDAVYAAYVETLLWTEHCNGTIGKDHYYCSGRSDCDTSFGDYFGEEDLADEARERVRAEVEEFVNVCQADRPDVFDGIPDEQIGHDFALTRNGHGAGFWDRGLGERGMWLTAMAKPYGSESLYVGDDGRLYVA